MRAWGPRPGQNVISLNVKKNDVQRLTFLKYKDWVPVKSKMAALKHGSRKFYDIPSEELSNLRSRYSFKKENNIEELLKYIDQSCIGKDVTFSGPYGARKGKLGAVSVQCIVRVTL